MNTTRHAKYFRLRVTLVGAVFMAGLGIVLGRAVYLQVLCGPALAQKASGQYAQTIHTVGKRGTIYDTQLRELAVSVESLSLAANPRQIEDRHQTARTLAPIVKMKAKTLAGKLKSKRHFTWIKRQITPRQAQAVRALDIDGIVLIPEHSRYYPNRGLASQLIGFTGIDGIGLEGLEYQFNAELMGRKQIFTVLKDAFGRGFETPDDVLRRDSGNNVVLTIDRTIQHVAERSLQQAVDTHRAKSGMAVVMAPQTGDVLAMAHYPFFNPNNFRDYRREIRRNRAVTDAFEPGSTMKLFSVAAALESGCCTPHTIFYCENGRYRIGSNTIHDTEKHGWLSLQRIVKFSSNIGAVKIGETIGPQALHRTLTQFGFGRDTGLQFPGETGGSLAAAKRWTRFDVAAASFGQGVSVSALQLTTAVAAIANDGMLMKPRVVRAITDPRGRVIREFKPQRIARVIASQTAAHVTRMMALVISEGGTGTQAALEGYTAGGKTGTAQKIGPSGTYAKNLYVSSFLGFAPLEEPRLAILVVLDEPREDYYGGVVAAPVFRQIAQEALGYLNVRPSRVTPRMTVSHTNEVTG
ncbi:MAG: penicillin-binding protein 2 [Desulfobacterales bacterium]|nr:penicillin-binding protein 2 [Desulfobacterales bacterium]